MGAAAEIENVVARLAHLADQGAVDEYIALFAEDGVWRVPDNPAGGVSASEKRSRSEIRAGAVDRLARGLQGPGTHSRHIVTTIAVDVIDDVHATARSYFMFVENTASVPTIQTVGRYDDTFVRTADGWKVSRREVTIG